MLPSELLYSGKVWQVESLANRLQFAKLKPSKAAVTINNPLTDLFIHQTFFHQTFSLPNFSAIQYLKDKNQRGSGKEMKERVGWRQNGSQYPPLQRGITSLHTLSIMLVTVLRTSGSRANGTFRL